MFIRSNNQFWNYKFRIFTETVDQLEQILQMLQVLFVYLLNLEIVVLELVVGSDEQDRSVEIGSIVNMSSLSGSFENALDE